jgi:two-component system chemotaxis response regulator CheB
MGKAQTIIVIGTSAGGVEALRHLAAALPAGFQASVFIVLHIGSHKSEMPSLLNQIGPLQAIHPKNGDLIHPGQIYVAPPDHHLVIEPGHLRLTKGPRENWARPAIDPLFRSAARSYGADVIGVVLTGGLNDGTAGLYEIKQCGGITVVQDPEDAVYPSMPRSALEHVTIDHCLPLAQISRLLVRLVAQRVADVRLDRAGTVPAKLQGKEMTAEYKLDQPVAITCPDCGGALCRTERGTLTQFRCHIGHVYTAEVMMAAQFAAMEVSLGAAMRSLNERGELCRQMAEKSRTTKTPLAGAQWDAAMREAKERASVLRQLLETEWTHPGGPELSELSAG